MRINYEDIYKRTLIYEIILYELDKINKIESAKLIAQTRIEMNTIEIELNKYKQKLDNYLMLLDTMVDDKELSLFNSKYNISCKYKDEKYFSSFFYYST